MFPFADCPFAETEGVPTLPLILGILLIPEILMRLQLRGGKYRASMPSDPAAVPVWRRLVYGNLDLGGGLLAVYAFLVPISAAFALILIAFLMNGFMPLFGTDKAAVAQAAYPDLAAPGTFHPWPVCHIVRSLLWLAYQRARLLACNHLRRWF